jgi:membrane protein DedA with SNARE-associated domain
VTAFLTADHTGGIAYLIIFVAAALEGEVIFATASVLVGLGRLDPIAVLVCGALGGSAGDQFFFFALRGRLHRWMSRFPRFARRQLAVIERVRAHSTLLPLACRFLPGLRIAIPAACAYAGIPAAKFISLNLISAFCWAGSIMVVVAWLGVKAIGAAGLHGIWGLIIPAILVVIFFRWLARVDA